MSADRYETWYYLTKNGWQVAESDQAPEPQDWVRFYEVEHHQGSPFGKQSHHFKMLRENPRWESLEAGMIEGKFERPNFNAALTPELLARIDGLGANDDK